MKDLIRRILREQTESKKDAVKSMIKKSGLEFTAKVMGGVNSILNNVYDGDILNFSEDTHTPIAYLSIDGMNLYLHEVLVKELGFKDRKLGYSSGEKELGEFSFGSKDGMEFKFNARLKPTRVHDQTYYKVLGMSEGLSGFGYSDTSKKNTLGKRYRQQIFKQIINKYDLPKYMTVKTFY